MKYKAIIFDLDGTIIDTEHIWLNASKELMRRRGITLDPETQDNLFNEIRGLATHKSCLLIKKVADPQDPLDNLIREKNELAHKLFAEHVRFIPGFVDFHRSIGTYNLKSGIATNAVPETTELTDSILNLHQFFGQHIYTIAHVNYLNKPNPAIYIHAAQQLSVDPTECIAIEDSAHGITAATSAGMYCIGINTSGNREFLKNAHSIVDSYEDINLKKLLELQSE